MIAFPSGARVWLATGHTDMRKGFGSLITFANVPASGAPSIVTRTCSPNAMVIEGRADGGAGDDGDCDGQMGTLPGPASFASRATRTGTNVGGLRAPLNSCANDTEGSR
jgi:hypothetical protein